MSAAPQYLDLTADTIAAALDYLDPDCCRDEWAEVAMALKDELGTEGQALFEMWSARGARYDAKGAAETWRSVKAGRGIGIGTLIYRAQQAGFDLRETGRTKLTADQIEARRAKREQERKAEEAAARKLAGAAARIANLTINAAEPARSHVYLDTKRVRAHGLFDGSWPSLDDAGDVIRQTPHALIIPIMDIRTGKIVSMQGIMVGPDGDIAKRYLRHGRKSGGCHALGMPPPGPGVVAVCEGYATGATIHELTGWYTIVAFDAPNLIPVTEAVRATFPGASIIVCADDDRWTQGNPGLTYAKRAADAAGGGLVLAPRFEADDGQPTDWNDLAAREGADIARAQLLDNPITRPAPAPLSQAVAPQAANANVDFYSPLIDVNGKGKPLQTIENVAEICRRLGVTVRYNVISKEEEILIPDAQFSLDNRANASLAWLESWCSRFNMSTDKLSGFITYLADQNLFNPVANWITSKPWDGAPRLAALCDTVTPVQDKRLPDGRKLAHVLITRWMLSAIAAAFEPDGVAAGGVLVLQGAQYCGKTMWFKQLVPRELGVLQDGMILRPDDRDSVKQICSFWLVELGELDATFRRSDIAALKAFITRKQDILRRAYARKESAYARRTVFFGSVNPAEYLHDPTGNRRYWTVDADAIDLAAQARLDMQQVWAEVLTLYRAGEGIYLTPDEMMALNAHNEGFTAIDPIEERLQTRLRWEADDTLWGWMTATEILLKIGVDRPTGPDATKCASLVRKMNGDRARKSNGRKLLFCPPGANDYDRPF